MPSPYPRDVRHSPRSSAAQRQTRSVGKGGSLVRVITPAPRRVRTPVRRALPLPAQAATNGAVQLAAATTVSSGAEKEIPGTYRAPHCQVRGPLGRQAAHGRYGYDSRGRLARQSFLGWRGGGPRAAVT